MRKVGVWLAGAYGNVATCVVAGTAAITRGLADTAGLVTETGTFEGLDLVPVDQLVFGGHEIRKGSLVRSAKEFGERNGVLTRELRTAVAQDLRTADAEIRPGVLLNAGDEVAAMADTDARGAGSPADLVARVQSDLRSFQERNKLDTVVVVNLISTEPLLGLSPALQSLDAFEGAIASGDVSGVPSSVLYAYAAVDAGFPFVDFTPAVAAGTAPVREAAQLRGVPHMGRDGKTGETLVKTVLAPMFLARHLPVLSWEGINMLGNRDGAVLREAGALASKVRDKDDALRRILKDDDTHSRVRIDYVPSLEDWKQAYDFIHFRGFLGARMQMHFLWQGCDSALAAPLVVDLVRLTDLAQRRGEVGTLPQLACFFKTPIDVPERDFASQMARLDRYARTVRRETKKLRRAGA
jgi:myo-inositol-1-phosphate synthase